MTMEYKAAKVVSLKNHPTLNERWLQDRIIEDPSILGLGNLDIRESERIQPTGGRLDLLLSDPDSHSQKTDWELGNTVG